MGRVILLLASLLLSLHTVESAIQRTDYLNHNLEALQQQLAAGASEPERLLVRSLGVRDTAAVLNMMRCIVYHPDSPDWVRAEGGRVLCDWFCLRAEEDSLRIYRQGLAVLGEQYHCAFLPEPRNWLVQIGAFSSQSNARRALRRLENEGVPVQVYHDGRLHFALAGAFGDKDAAQTQARYWRERGWIKEYRLREKSDVSP